MIARIQGTLLELMPERILINVGGIGYQLFVPFSTLENLGVKVGEKIELKTYLHIRENAHILYGFATEQEKNVFLLLVDRVSGIGPSIALSVLSGMTVSQFQQAVVSGDSIALAQVKGLGKKTAERIILELRDKVGVVETWQIDNGMFSETAKDAELALIALGFKQSVARKLLANLIKESPDASTEDLVRGALQKSRST